MKEDLPDNVRELQADSGLTNEEFEDIMRGADVFAAKELVLLCRGQYFVRCEEGAYRGPLSRDEVRSVIEDEAPTEASLPLPGKKDETILRTSNGSLRDLPDIVQRAGTVLKRVRLLAHVPGESRQAYDPQSKILSHEVARWKEGVEPAYSKEIARWLELLCGDMTGKFLDWLATFRRVDRPTCAPYIEGVSSAGKEMLAAGLAQLTEAERIIRYEHLTSDFNDGLLDSMFVYADEKMPDQGSKRGAPSAVFRTLIGTDRLEVNGKGTKKMELRGCPRVLITANNARALNLIREELEKADVDAVGKRLLYIRAADGAEGAVDYLEELGGRQYTDAWVDGMGIARHVTWLEENREVVVGSRFLVQGNPDDVRSLVIGHEQDEILEALTQYLVRCTQTRAERSGLGGVRPPVRSPRIVPGDGGLFVHGPTLAGLWSELVQDKKAPGVKKIGRMLANVSSGRCHRDIQNSRISGYLIPGKLIVQFSDVSGVGDPSYLQLIMEKGLPSAQRAVTPHG